MLLNKGKIPLISLARCARCFPSLLLLCISRNGAYALVFFFALFLSLSNTKLVFTYKRDMPVRYTSAPRYTSYHFHVHRIRIYIENITDIPKSFGYLSMSFSLPPCYSLAEYAFVFLFSLRYFSRVRCFFFIIYTFVYVFITPYCSPAQLALGVKNSYRIIHVRAKRNAHQHQHREH